MSECSSVTDPGLCSDNPTLCPDGQLTWYGGDLAVIPDACCGSVLPGRLLPNSSVVSTAGDSSSTCSYYIPPGEGANQVLRACPGLSIPDICALSTNVCDSSGSLSNWDPTQIAMLPDWCCGGISPGRLLDTGAVTNISAQPQLSPPPASLNCTNGTCLYAGFLCIQAHPCAGWLNVQAHTNGSLCGPCNGSIPTACASSEPSTSDTIGSTIKNLLCTTLATAVPCDDVSVECAALYYGCDIFCNAVEVR